MNSTTGAIPPLHRRFNKQKAIRYIRNRYRVFRTEIAEQVEGLQQDAAFSKRCRYYYRKGYKDWVIISGVYNCMLNWKGRELGLDLSSEEDQKQMLELQNKLHGTIYPTSRFLGEDMDLNLTFHFGAVLKTYGFEMRRMDFRPDVLEKFLRERMRHFDFDLPHEPLFGEPPGNWPKT